MRVIPLHRDDPSDYACVSYWILGENNTASDRNTLIDTGSTNPENLAHFLREMALPSKGIGKQSVEQVILTHEHFDHTGGLPGIEQQFRPDTFAWKPFGARYNAVHDGMFLMVGDQLGKLLHTPGHSEDSICVHLPESGTLFSGDTLYRISDHLGAYPKAYVSSLERLAGLDIKRIYPGHGQPILRDAMGFIRSCLENVHLSLIKD
ncbi:MAG: MBL fold metallo-hydrolase [Holophagaceae bacterium]|nr:MBL fold metallo-hydrolase [Holophagaceae bacterium]